MVLILITLCVLFVDSIKSNNYPKVLCTTTKGDILIEVYPEWSPLGANRFLELVEDNFYTNIAFFRSVKHFLTQFGITEDVTKKHWHNNNIKDDSNLHLGIKQNYVSFAGGGPNTRSTQLFIAFEDLNFLGNEPWETPFGKVIEGQNTLDNLYKGYGDIPPFGKGPDHQQIHRQGNHYIKTLFPRIDFLLSCNLLNTELQEEPKEALIVIDNESTEKDIASIKDKSPIKIINPQLRTIEDEVISKINTDVNIDNNNSNRNQTLIFKSISLLLVALVMGYLYYKYGKASNANKTL